MFWNNVLLRELGTRSFIYATFFPPALSSLINEQTMKLLLAILLSSSPLFSSDDELVISRVYPRTERQFRANTFRNRLIENDRQTSDKLLQPTYQNREAIEESIAKSSGGGKMPSLNNNLSELDTLLQDLSNARYNAHYQERGQQSYFHLYFLPITINCNLHDRIVKFDDRNNDRIDRRKSHFLGGDEWRL